MPMGLYKYLIIFEMCISKHAIMIHNMKGGVGGNLAGGKLCVTLFTTVIIVFKRGGVYIIGGRALKRLFIVWLPYHR